MSGNEDNKDSTKNPMMRNLRYNLLRFFKFEINEKDLTH